MAIAATINAGTPALFRAVFSDEETETPGDPGDVCFSWQTPAMESPTVYTYGVGDEITRALVDDRPTYSVAVATLGLAPAGDKIVLTGQWDTQDGITVSESIDVLLMAPEIPSPF